MVIKYFLKEIEQLKAKKDEFELKFHKINKSCDKTLNELHQLSKLKNPKIKSALYKKKLSKMNNEQKYMENLKSKIDDLYNQIDLRITKCEIIEVIKLH